MPEFVIAQFYAIQFLFRPHRLVLCIYRVVTQLT
jgi:hypothetical protein